MIKMWMLLMMGLAALVDGRTTAEDDMQMNCPSHCVCKLFPMPGVHCYGYMSLPGVFPHNARLFNCTDCNIVRITDKSLESYERLTHLILAGNSPLVIEGSSLQFLKNFRYLELEGYEIAKNDLISLIVGNRTLVMKNISLKLSNASVPLADTTAAGASSKSPTSSVEEDGLVTIKGTLDGSPSIPATGQGGDIGTIPSEASQVRDATPVSEAPEETSNLSACNNYIPTWLLVIAVIPFVVETARVIAWCCKYRNRPRREYEHVAPEDASKKSENVLVADSNRFPTEIVLKVYQSLCRGCSRSFTGTNDAQVILHFRLPAHPMDQNVKALLSVMDNSDQEQDEETLNVVSNTHKNSSENKCYIAVQCQKGNSSTNSLDTDRDVAMCHDNANRHFIKNLTKFSSVRDIMSQKPHNATESLDCGDEFTESCSDGKPHVTPTTKIDKSDVRPNQIKSDLEHDVSECGNVGVDDLEPDSIIVKSDFLGNRPQNRNCCDNERNGNHNKPSYRQIYNIIVNPIAVNNRYHDDNSGEINSACSHLTDTNYQSKFPIPNENQQSKISDNDDRYKNRTTDCLKICDSTQDNPNYREIRATDNKKCNNDNIKLIVYKMNNYTPCSVTVDNNDNI